jgi:hypothetical protein
MNKDACDTIKTRTAYHWLKENKKAEIYNDYFCRPLVTSISQKSVIKSNLGCF